MRIHFQARLLLVLCFLALSCKNKNGHGETPPSVVETNPAYKTLNDSIRLFPQDASLYLRRGARLTLENAHELAYDDFHQAWSLQPSLETALPFSANLEVLGRQKEKRRLLETLNRQIPGNERVGRLLAESYAATGNPDKALNIYNTLIAKDSLDPDMLYEKALLLEQLKDTAAAIAALQHAYGIQGVDTYGLELAHLYAEQKNPRALDICNYILKQDSLQLLIDPLFIKGIYYANTAQYPKAIAQFNACIRRDWKTTDAYLEKGRAYFHLNNYQAAMETFNMAITVTNSDPDAYYWLGRSYEAQHRNQDAILNYSRALALDKQFTEARERMKNLEGEFAHPSH